MNSVLTAEDIDWLRKLRNAKASNHPSPDIPTSVVRKLTMLVRAEVKSPRELKFRGGSESFETDRRKQSS